MRIGIVGPSERFLSGVSYHTIYLSNALVGKSDVTAVLFRHMLPSRLFPGWKRVGKTKSGIKYNQNVAIHDNLDWYNPITWLKGAGILASSDILIFQWWTVSVAHMYLALQLLNIKKIPIIIEFHEVTDPLEHSFFILRMYARLMGSLIRRFAVRYVVHSEADKKIISEHYSIDPIKIEVIPLGLFDQYPNIEKSRAKQQLDINEDYVILFFGLLRPYKGVKYLIEAFNRLPENIIKKSRLMLVGETWEDKESITLAHQSQHREKITLVDRYISDGEIPLYFSAADVLVLPYTRASQSAVAHIGMSFGLPIIVSQVGGLVESLEKYEGTYFIQPENSQKILEALLDVLKEKKVYSIPHDLRWDTIAHHWLQLVNLLKNKKID